MTDKVYERWVNEMVISDIEKCKGIFYDCECSIYSTKITITVHEEEPKYTITENIFNEFEDEYYLGDRDERHAAITKLRKKIFGSENE